MAASRPATWVVDWSLHLGGALHWSKGRKRACTLAPCRPRCGHAHPAQPSRLRLVWGSPRGEPAPARPTWRAHISCRHAYLCQTCAHGRGCWPASRPHPHHAAPLQRPRCHWHPPLHGDAAHTQGSLHPTLAAQPQPHACTPSPHRTAARSLHDLRPPTLPRAHRERRDELVERELDGRGRAHGPYVVWLLAQRAQHGPHRAALQSARHAAAAPAP